MKQTIKKMRNRLNPTETFYWIGDEVKEIDGVRFIPVLKRMGLREIPHWMRLDALEHVR